MKFNLTIFWAYLSEIILVSFIYGILFVVWNPSELVTFIRAGASDLASYFSAVMLAGSIAFLWVFYSKSDTPFAEWLYSKGAFNVYLNAYIFTVGVYASLTIVLILTKHIKGNIFSLVTLWVLILGVINIYTFMKNIFEQLRLNMEFNSTNNNKP